jgi:hypothetical protein
VPQREQKLPLLKGRGGQKSKGANSFLLPTLKSTTTQEMGIRLSLGFVLITTLPIVL